MNRPLHQIPMVDLKSQYAHIKEAISEKLYDCLESGAFIQGPAVKIFETRFKEFLKVKHVISCANGTDALQISLMALDLQPGDEVICPAFTYVATAEVIGLLGLKPVMVDVDPDTFNLDVVQLSQVLTSRTRAIVPVHLYGQSSNMQAIMAFAHAHHLYVVEDNAQAINANYRFSDGTTHKTGTIGHIGCTSFFPSKNLGCYGDGGAIMTNDDDLATKIRMIANHGQNKKYYHKVLGCNSRLDTLQAEVLNIKLNYLDQYTEARNIMASFYDEHLKGIPQIQIPQRAPYSNHVFHQYTIKVGDQKRDALKAFLSDKGIPSMVYYPLPLYKQEAFKRYVPDGFILEHTETLCEEVLSLPIHTEFNERDATYIVGAIKDFFKH